MLRLIYDRRFKRRHLDIRRFHTKRRRHLPHGVLVVRNARRHKLRRTARSNRRILRMRIRLIKLHFNGRGRRNRLTVNLRTHHVR